MGIFDDSFSIMGSMARGTAAATVWTGNMIYTALQNAKTKREVKQIYYNASNTNFQNRAVAIMPGLSKQQLMLVSNEPSDNDVYDYQTKSSTAALDYIWGVTTTPNSMIVSGGQICDRVNALVPFVHKAQSENIPVVVLHNNDDSITEMILSHSICFESVSRKGCFYDAFRGLPVDDIAFLLFETMDKDLATPTAESLLRALIEILLITEGKITFQNLASFPLISLKKKIDEIKNKGFLSGDEYQEITHYYMAGSQNTDAVRIFLDRLNRQATSVYGNSGSNPSNIKKILNQNGVIAIDVGNTGNELITTFIINYLILLHSQGKRFMVVVDGIPIAKYIKLKDLLNGTTYAISNADFVSSLYGGEIKGDELFSEITGNVDTIVLFRHASGTSCQKWSDHFGKYKKIRIRYNIGQNNAFMNSSNSRGISVDETDEPRIRGETISKLSSGIACIQNIDGILIADINYS